MGLAVLAVATTVLESRLWPGRFWGAHFYAFFPSGLLPIAALAALAFIAWAAFAPARPAVSGAAAPRPATRRLVAGMAALGSGALFWVLRERHLFWGDALPLSINLPRGQAFHPDEPLTMFVHQALYRLGGGHVPAVTAVAIGSVLAGMVFTGWLVHWLSGRGGGWTTAGLGAALVLAQGSVSLFFGHVEDYSYVAVPILVFFTTGVDYLEGNGGLLAPLLAAIVAYAFHILGGLLAVPALVLALHGLRDPARRAAALRAMAIAAAVTAAALAAAAPLYAGRSPLGALLAAAAKVLSPSSSLALAHGFTARDAANLWSQLQLVGPLSLPMLALVSAVLLASGFARRESTVFLLAGATALMAPRFVLGEGALGAARDWDIFAAPALAAPFAGVVLLTAIPDRTQARRLLVALLAASLFHTAPWVALNTDVHRAIERVASLPLTGGRGETMIGTYYLNRGDLAPAEDWFRRAIARDSTNCNSQSGLGLALARQQRLTEAVAPMQAAVQLRPGVLAYRDDLIALLMQLDRWPDVREVVRGRLQWQPEHAPSWLLLAQCDTRLGDPDAAVRDLERGCRLMPADSELTAGLANQYVVAIARHAQARQWAAAREFLGRFAVRFPRDLRLPRMEEALR